MTETSSPANRSLRGAWRRATLAATGSAPHVRAETNLLSLEVVLVLALLPCAAAGIVSSGHHAVGGSGSVLSLAAGGVALLVPRLAAALATAFACALGFARARGRPLVPGTTAAAVVFALLLPPDVPVWQVSVGAAFGFVAGREVFGGPGRTFVHPAVVGLVFLQVAFPAPWRAAVAGEGGLAALAAGGEAALRAAGLSWGDALAGLDRGGLGDASAVACGVGAVFLAARRAISLRVLAGGVLGVATATALLAGPGYPGVPWYGHLALGSLAFVLVFVATDSASGAITGPGRWLHGALVGALAVLIRVASPVHVEGALLAALLASVFAPLVDHAVVAVHVRRRSRA